MSPEAEDPERPGDLAHPGDLPHPEELPRAHEATTVEEAMIDGAPDSEQPTDGSALLAESAYTPADDVRADGDRWLDERREADADHHRRGHDLTGHPSAPPEEEGL